MSASRVPLAAAVVFLVASLLVTEFEREALIATATAAPARVGCIVLALLLVAATLVRGWRAVGTGRAPDGTVASPLADALEGASDVAFYGLDRLGVVRRWSRGAERLFGYRADEMKGRSIAGKIYEAAQDAELLAEVDRIYETGRSHGVRRMLVSDGQGRGFETLATVVPLLDEGRIAEVAVLHLDPREAEGADERRVRLFDSAPVGLLRVSLQGSVDSVNQRFADWVGRRTDAIVGNDVDRSEVLPEDVRLRIRAVAVAPQKPGAPPLVVESDLTLVTSDGVARPFYAVVAARPGGGADAVFLDGTSRQRLLAERDAARAALTAARETAVEQIESTARDLTSTVQEMVAAMEAARDEKAGPIGRRHAEEEIEKSGKRFLVQAAEAAETARRGLEEQGRDASSKERSPTRVLLVDDNDENRELIAHMLSSRGADVVALGSGREAVDAAARSRFDFVLLDVQMPEMDGYQVVRRLRALPGGDQLAVVALTALSSDAIRDRCVAEGMDDFVSKPVTLASIGELVSRWGSSRR